jgi:hypothetical protein
MVLAFAMYLLLGYLIRRFLVGYQYYLLLNQCQRHPDDYVACDRVEHIVESLVGEFS